MDYQGQRNAERLGQATIVLGFFIGTVYGWARQNLLLALYGWLIGLALSFVLCVPAWPWFRRHPIKWLPNRVEESESESESESDSEEQEEKRAERSSSKTFLLPKKVK